MPIYEYKCEECGKTFEVLTKASNRDDEKKCPDCGSKKVKRAFSVFGVGGSGGNSTSQSPSCGGG